MARCLDGVSSIEGGVGEGHLEEVPADDLAEGVEPRFAVVGPGPAHLVLVDRNAHDIGSGVRGNGAHRAADAASDVQDLLPGAGADQICRALFVDPGGLLVGSARKSRGEMEGLAPAPLVNVGNEVVEGVHEGGNFLFLFAGVVDLAGATKEGPVLLILVLNLVIGDGSHLELHRALALLLRGTHHPHEPVQAEAHERRRAEQSGRLHYAAPTMKNRMKRKKTLKSGNRKRHQR